MLYIGQLFDANEKPQAAPRLPWTADQWTRLGRFLILGCERGDYRAGAWQFDIEDAPAVRQCLLEDGPRVVKTIVEVSAAGIAADSGPALVALALAASPNFASPETNAAAFAALPEVVRTGTELCTFAAFAGSFRGWGRGLRSAIADWYLNKPAADLACQLIQSQPRDTVSHSDLVRLAHPKAETSAHNALFEWLVNGELGHWASSDVLRGELRQLEAFEWAKKAANEIEVVRLIEDYRLTQEMIPPRWLESARVWEALLDSMPYAALLSNLGKLTAVGLLAPENPATALAVARLMDRKRVANSGVHPIAVLAAMRGYARGREDQRALEWAPVPSVSAALDHAFYLAFENIQPCGKRIYLAISAAKSLEQAACHGMPSVSAGMASAALAMLFTRTEPDRSSQHFTIASGMFASSASIGWIAPAARSSEVRRRPMLPCRLPTR